MTISRPGSPSKRRSAIGENFRHCFHWHLLLHLRSIGTTEAYDTICHCYHWITNVNIGNPLATLSPKEPLSSWIVDGAPFTPLNRLVTIGVDGINGAIFATVTVWRSRPGHHHVTAPLSPFEWHQWSPMAMGYTIGAIRSIVIGANGSPSAPFCRHWHKWRQWREFQIVLTLLPRWCILLRAAWKNFW